MDKISTRAVGRKLQNSDEKIHRAEKNQEILHIHGQEDNTAKTTVLYNLTYRFDAAPNQNPSKLFHGYQRNDSEVNMEKENTQNIQH